MSDDFTPGPWVAQRPHNTAGDTHVFAPDAADGSTVCVAWNCRPVDARLIAAAPELAAACRAALNLAWEVGSETEDGVKTLLDDGRGDLYRQLSAALVKAGLL